LNKTCYGNCGRVEAAFNETAEKFAQLPNAPNMAVVNCDYQPILCGSWGAAAGWLWLFEMKPLPAEIDIYKKRLNLTSTTSEDLVALFESNSKDSFTLLHSFWHPFNSNVAKFDLAVPLAYILWIPSLFPQWVWMLFITLISRRMMSRRLQNQMNQQPAGAAPRPVPPAQ